MSSFYAFTKIYASTLNSRQYCLFVRYLEATVPLPWATRMMIAFGAAKGLAFLHNAERPVIYRDFKTSNILLDSVSLPLTLKHPWNPFTKERELYLPTSLWSTGLYGKAFRLRTCKSWASGWWYSCINPCYGDIWLCCPWVRNDW